MISNGSLFSRLYNLYELEDCNLEECYLILGLGLR